MVRLSVTSQKYPKGGEESYLNPVIYCEALDSNSIFW